MIGDLVQVAPFTEVPHFGEPCNGCGMCCQQMPCSLASELLNCTEGPCVALELVDGVGRCGLIRRPSYYLEWISNNTKGLFELEAANNAVSEMFSKMLGIGRGCCSSDNQTRAWAAQMRVARKEK